MAGKKKGGSVAAAVFDIALPIAEKAGLSIWDVKYEKEGSLWYLRVFIEKEGGVDVDDCEALSRPLSDALDIADPIDSQYILEVGSPGLGRQLRREEHFLRFLECPVRIRYIREKEGVKEFIAILNGYNREDGSIDVTTEKGDMNILISDTAFIRLYDDEDFDE